MQFLRLTCRVGRDALGVCFAAAVASAQQTICVSQNRSGVHGNDKSEGPSISADGRLVAFSSTASNLVAGDTRGYSDVFVRERYTSSIVRVSVDSSGGQANQYIDHAVISADGRFVAFRSDASNLVAGDTNGSPDVFVHELSSGITERVSVDSSGKQGNAGSSWFAAPAISADGRFVTFCSQANNLVAGDANGFQDVFVHDRATGVTERVSVSSSGGEADAPCGHPTISADGRFVAFSGAADNLVAGDTVGSDDVFVHDRATGHTERVSVDSSGGPTLGSSVNWSISADGRLVGFSSYKWSADFSDTNRTEDVFVHDRSTGITERVSVDSSGSEANGPSVTPQISADGRLVVFRSAASNLVFRDSNQVEDVFVHDRADGITERVSVDTAGGEATGYSMSPAIAADVSVIAFQSYADNLVAGDMNLAVDVFAREFCLTAAAWSNYGAGFPGTNGIPAFTSRQNPVLGTTMTLDLANSFGSPTVGVLFIGLRPTKIHTRWGGDLLVAAVHAITIPIAAGGDSFTLDIPANWTRCGDSFDLHALEVDAGAAKGVSFTAGVELVLGR